MPGEDAELEEKKTYKVQFGQIYLSKPMVTEADGMTSTLFPKEARLRNFDVLGAAVRGHDQDRDHRRRGGNRVGGS